MSIKKSISSSFLVSSMLATVAWAAVPASGELTDSVKLVEWDGSGPYVIPNVTPTGGAESVVCEPSLPPVCDEFILTVNVSDEFREMEENQRESVRIGIEYPVSTGQEDYDMYLYDAAGTLIGDSAGAAGVQEVITVPLKTLKNGSYTVTVIPYTAFGTNYSGAAQIGKNPTANKSGADQFGGSLGIGLVLGLLGLFATRQRRV